MRNAMVLLVAVAVAVAGGCGAGDDGERPVAARRHAAPAVLPDGAVILPEARAGELLRQCSRGAPAEEGASWTPAPVDVATLEAALPAALAREGEWRRIGEAYRPERWRRQYVGIVRDGRRLVYGNAAPVDTIDDTWRTEPILVCDGGPSFFGVVWDVVASRIVQVDFNGPPAPDGPAG